MSQGRLEAALRNARRNGIPGLAAEIRIRGRRRAHAIIGDATIDPEPRPLSSHPVFDLASLTKVVTTTLVALRIGQGRLALEQRIGSVLGPGPNDSLTLEQLLLHQTGLPSWRPFFRGCAGVPPLPPGARSDPLGPAGLPPDPPRWTETPPLGSAAARRAILEEALHTPAIAPAGTEIRYSDLNFMILAAVLEAEDGQRLDAQVAQIAPKLRFRPPPHARGPEDVATEQGFEGALRWGRVHDDNCLAMGGISGHAGLFGTVDAVAELGQLWLDALDGRGPIPADTARQFTRPRTGTTRRLGFDGPSPTGYTSAGRGLSPDSFGHLGFTGTSLWVDPTRALVVALLTNRVHPARSGPGLAAVRALRPRVGDLAASMADRG